MTSEFYTGYPAITVNTYGKGKAYFLAARTDDALLKDFYGAIIRSENIACAIQSSLPSGVTAQVRKSDQQRFVFLMNFTDQSQRVELGEAPFIDVVTESQIGKLVTLAPYDVRIISASIDNVTQ